MANFFVETNRMESFVAVYFIIFKEWNEINIGIISMVMNLLMITFQTPAGDLLDKTTYKKTITAIAILVASVTTTAVVWTSTFWIVLIMKCVEGLAATIFLPALITLLLGVCSKKEEEATFIAKAEVYNKAGSVLFTLGCGLITYFMYPEISSMFYLLGSGGLAATVFICLIPTSAIDYDRARKALSGSDPNEKDDDQSLTLEDLVADEELVVEQEEPKTKASIMSYKALLGDRSILLFGVTTFMYHLSNAGITPILSQYIAIGNHRAAMVFVSANLLLAYAVQGITARVMEKLWIEKISHRHLVIVAHIILPIRCVVAGLLIYFWDNSYALSGSMILEGLGAGIYDTIIPIVVGTMTEGTGRFGFTFGFIITCWRLGHGFSLLLSEFLVHDYGYITAFVALGLIGIVSLIVFTALVDITKVAKGDGNPETDLPDTVQKSSNRRSTMMMMNSFRSSYLLIDSANVSGTPASGIADGSGGKQKVNMVMMHSFGSLRSF